MEATITNPHYVIRITMTIIAIIALIAGITAMAWTVATATSGEERSTYEARCHAAANWAGHSAYAILEKAKPDSCRIMLPEGGIPVSLSWTGYP